MFCPECGVDHHAEERAAKPTEADVEIARIQAKRDVEIARLSAGVEKSWNETMHDANLAAAEGVIEGMVTGAELVNPEPDPAAAEPVIISTDIAPEPEPELDAPPPPAAAESEPEEKEPASKASTGWWGNYPK